jgi:uncharacterized protein YeaO (DUF488 family)
MPAPKPDIRVKRVYEEASDSDGVRVLVDRLWPRGLTKEEARVDLWLKNVAPSTELRKWFHAHPEEREKFRQRYVAELRGKEAHEGVRELQKVLDEEAKVTLLCASRNLEYNNATVLRDVVAAKPQSVRSRSETAQKTRTRGA